MKKQEIYTTDQGTHIRKMTAKEIIKTAIEGGIDNTIDMNESLDFTFGCKEEFHRSSWYGLVKKHLFDTVHLCFGHWGGSCIFMVCLEEVDEQDAISEMENAIKKIQKTEGNEIWMEVV